MGDGSDRLRSSKYACGCIVLTFVKVMGRVDPHEDDTETLAAQIALRRQRAFFAACFLSGKKDLVIRGQR